jgi:hypothetical protein|tara:strand:+ start:311 stop:514 length:204 start_codon:yes stop_codon:yes gene_type:complete
MNNQDLVVRMKSRLKFLTLGGVDRRLMTESIEALSEPSNGLTIESVVEWLNGQEITLTASQKKKLGL